MARTPKITLLVAALTALALTLGIAACGEENHHKVPEGEPVEFGELRFNVSLTRFLNPADVEDSAYLVGHPEPPVGQDYLGVFIELHNESEDDVAHVPDAEEFEVTDTTGALYEPLESESVFALEFGAEIPADSSVPADDTPARSGPTQGALLLFLVDEVVSENRPLELEILHEGEERIIELDI